MTDNKFLLLRRQKGVERKEVCEALGVAESSLKRWEYSARYPSKKSLKKLADYYGVDVSFFDDSDVTTENTNNGSIAPQTTISDLQNMNGEPIWYVGTKEWYLVNSDEQYIINSKGQTLKFEELKELYIAKKPIFVESVTIPIIEKENEIVAAIPLKRREILASKQVYVEVITSDSKLAEQLSGIYTVVPEKEYVQNGNLKFYLRHLNKKWLAFLPEAKR